MSDIKAKMYQIQFWLGLCPRPLGSLQRSPSHLAGLRGLLLRGGEGTGRGGKGRGKEKRGRRKECEGEREPRGGERTRPHFTPPNPYFWIRPCFNPLEFKGNYDATSNNMKSVHWLLIGGL